MCINCKFIYKQKIKKKIEFDIKKLKHSKKKNLIFQYASAEFINIKSMFVSFVMITF